MKLDRYIQIEDRRIASLERKYAARIYAAFKKQVDIFIKTNVFDERPLAEVIKDLYYNVERDYLSRQWEQLQADLVSKKERFFLKMWEFWLDEQGRKLGTKITGMNDVTHEKLKQAAAEATQEAMVQGATFGQLEDEIRKRVNNSISKYRARMIARTEVGSAIAEAKKKSADDWANETGLEQVKMWIHRGAKDPRDWHRALDTRIPIPRDQKWVVTDPNTLITDLMDYPHDENASAGNVINCGCTIIYTVPKR